MSLVESSSWGSARLERLRDVEWAARRALPHFPERLVGVALASPLSPARGDPHFGFVAGKRVSRSPVIQAR